MTVATDAHTEPLTDYVNNLAETHGVSGYTTTPDGTVVYAAYDDGSYDLHTPDGQLTDPESDVTEPEWLAERQTLLAYRDEAGNEQYDLLEVDPDSGAITPVLDDQFMNVKARQHPTDPNRIAFVSNRDRSLDLYTLHLDDGEIIRHSDADTPVMGYAWSPDGDRLAHQAGTFEDTTIRVASLTLGRDDVFIDEPDSEQSFAFTDDGAGAWSDKGSSSRPITKPATGNSLSPTPTASTTSST
jgi:Tol biopolymer transport system component